MRANAQIRNCQPAESAADRCLFSAGLKLRERFFQQLTANFLLVFGRNRGIADDVDNAVAEHRPVGADHLGDGQRRSDLHGWDAGFFQFGGDRSAAASAGSSRRRENDRVDAETLGLLGHFASHAPGVRQRIGQTRG